jgi:S-adenosylmethionine:tRNA ribosyltransferase-isomerase
MLTELFDFTLPNSRIALRPAKPRDSAKLLVVQENGEITHRHFWDLPDLLSSSDILSFNDTKVIAARLNAQRPPRIPGGPTVSVELTLHRRMGEAKFQAFALPARRLRPGDALAFGQGLEAQVQERHAGEVLLAFNRSGLILDGAIAACGAMPLPPYIAKLRPPDDRDFSDYQTVYAREEGSVAAPTAGLHFTHELLDRLAAKRLGRVDLTLHVGAGTFLPVSAADTDQHVMHSEYGCVTADAALRLNAARTAGGRIVAVGTTSLRTLESASTSDGVVHPFTDNTAIFITPGYCFKAVDALVTNFHLPRSTLFMLVCAFMGLETMQRAYAEAIRKEYNFYSYGDACLLLRPR